MKVPRWIVVAAVVVAGCATNPATGRRQLLMLSEQEEIQLGRESDQEIRGQMGVYADAALQQYVERIGRELVRSSYRPGLPWSFAVVDEPAVNAFALPGGFVYVTRGILPFVRDEAELAAVMGHEIGHVDGRHGVEAYSQQVLAGGSLAVAGVLLPEIRPFQGLAGVAAGLMFLKHGRDAELEADQIGVRYASAQGWDPGGLPGLLATFGRLDEASGSRRGVPNWALSHPPAEDRIARLEQAVAAARTPTATATNRTEFERHIDGVVFGDSREKGFVRGSDFLHPVMRFAVRFPSGWSVVNSDEQVSALESEAGSVGMLLRLVAKPSGSIEQVAQTSMSNAGFVEASGRRERINGLTAYVGSYSATLEGGSYRARAAHIQLGSQVFLVAGLASANDFGRVDDAFLTSIRSFRELSREEADDLQPDRVDFRVVRSGDTWESLVKAGGANVRARTLAIMNGYDPATPPRAGERVRIVVGG